MIYKTGHVKISCLTHCSPPIDLRLGGFIVHYSPLGGSAGDSTMNFIKCQVWHLLDWECLFLFIFLRKGLKVH